MKIQAYSIKDCVDTSRAVSVNAEQYAEAIAAGAEKISACQVGARHWYYYAAETREVYRLTRAEVASMGLSSSYSLWCAQTGRPMRRPSKAVRSALCIES